MGNTSIELIGRGEYMCECGKMHRPLVKKTIIKEGALKELPDVVKEFGGTKIFVLDDKNTHAAAGEKVCSILKDAGIPYTLFTIDCDRTEPDEHAVGSVMLHFDEHCDMVVGVGSGVINDIGKIVANIARRPYTIVGTAPSMDGYAAGTSSVIRDNLKVSVNSKCPDVVIGDLDVLANAPINMIRSGLGDMIAKYISICEWKISKIINDEYYCADTADIIMQALMKLVDNAAGVTSRDKEAVTAVMEGMVLSGIGANYAGVSRPVSGMEHYFSHIWDMRMIEFGTPWDLHGVQCGIGTLDCIKVYDKIRNLTPSREKALAYVESFDNEKWNEYLRKNLGKGAEQMIKTAKAIKMYDKDLHRERLEKIIAHWDEIIAVINELPSYEELEKVFDAAGAPKYVEDIGITKEEERMAFLMSKDIRDKYIGSRLLWDIGELDNVANEVFPV